MSATQRELKTLLGCAMVVCLAGCDRTAGDKARDRLNRLLLCPNEHSAETIAAAAEQLGDKGTQRVRTVALSERDVTSRIVLAKALLLLDVNDNLRTVVSVVASHIGAREHIALFLEGRMDIRTRDILQETVRDGDRGERVVACRFLQLVADDQTSLELGQSLLADDAAETDEEIATYLALVGDAAAYNKCSAAVAWVEPYLQSANTNIRSAAVMALRGIPGGRAEGLLLAIANDQDDPLSSVAAQFLLTRERTLEFAEEHVAPGWVRRSGDEREGVGKMGHPCAGESR